MGIKPTSDVVALSLLTAAEAGHAFSAYLPSYFTIKSFALDGDPTQVQHKIDNLRSGYRPAIVFGFILGGVVSILAKSPLPLVASTGASAIMLTQYEDALPTEYRLSFAKLAATVLMSGSQQTALPAGRDMGV